MEAFMDSFIVQIQSIVVNGIKILNYYVYRMEWLIIFLGFFTAISFAFLNRENYLYRDKLSKWIKVSLLMIIASFVIKNLENQFINKIFDVVFYNLIPITFLTLALGYILDKFVFYRNTKVLKTEEKYLNHTINITYMFLLIASMYGTKYSIIAFIWQINFITLKFWLEIKSPNAEDRISDLYETRKHQLNILEDLIKNSDYENYAIALNGEWGSGKSELIKALITENKINKNYYIYIKPMVSDTSESLISQFKKSISKLMKENGIYSGRNSSLDKYFTEVLKLIQFNNKVSLSNFLTNDSDSYDDLKTELQNDLDSLLMSNRKDRHRLIVIIDDFDRIDEDKQLGILAFIKEIIDFRGCITIIALDYENLKNNKVVTPEYLEKFIATQLPLVDIEFKEIIEFHAKELLNDNDIDYVYSKKILQEIKDNIYNFYNKIEERITSYYQKEKDRIEKIKDNEKEKKDQKDQDKELQMFMNFCIERRKNNDNSRRVIHFLKEIKNTVVLIDKLYRTRKDGERLLDTVKVSEVVYFFNYIKVFYKDAYESIIKLKGIEEYRANLIRNGNKLEEKYFRVILGDIIPETSYFFRDEYKDLSLNNTLNLVKDIFINYYFSKNNIEFLTNSEKILSEIDNDNISITDNYIEKLQIYNDTIFKQSDSQDILLKRIKCLIKYMIVLYNEKIIDFKTFIKISTSKYATKYIKFYLMEACQLIDENKVKINSEDKRKISYYIEHIEMDNITEYRYLFIELLIIASLDKRNDNEIKKYLEQTYKTEELCNRIIQYCIDKGIVKDNQYEAKKIIDILIRDAKNKEYKVIDLDLLKRRLDEFFINYNYIKKLKMVDTKVGPLDKYKELSKNLNIKDINEAKLLITDLAKEEVITTDMVSCFQQLLTFIINEKNLCSLDEEYKIKITQIYKNIKKEDCWNEYAWFNIMVNVERIIFVESK